DRRFARRSNTPGMTGRDGATSDRRPATSGPCRRPPDSFTASESLDARRSPLAGGEVVGPWGRGAAAAAKGPGPMNRAPPNEARRRPGSAEVAQRLDELGPGHVVAAADVPLLGQPVQLLGRAAREALAA